MELNRTKTCKGCNLELPLTCFNKHSTTKDGLRAKCVECRRIEHIKYREENPEKIREIQRICDARKVATPEAKEKKRLRNKLYDQSERGRLSQTRRYERWKAKNPNRTSKSRTSLAQTSDYKRKRAVAIRKWRDKNKEKCQAFYAQRRASRMCASPPWLSKEDKEFITDLYIVCKMFQLYTGQEYHVDHIVPLKNSLVCGLHIPANLQILPAKENLSKRNKFDEKFGIDFSASAYS